ncbi:MAG TPA: TerC family protein [Alphaproteobacteria bacterium]
MFDFAHILTAGGMTSLISLTALEVVLGIDNVVFIALLVQHLPAKQARQVRAIGLSAALILRILLLFTISWMLKLTEPLVSVFGNDFSGRDLLMIVGGLFLIYKAVTSMRDMFTDETEHELKGKKASYTSTIVQIMFIDLVLSFDSVITAIGLTQNLPIIIIAIMIAIVTMILATGKVAEFIKQYPSIKTLAISFILLVGVLLIGDGAGYHIPRPYIYFAMAFAAGTEVMNIMTGTRREQDPKGLPAKPKKAKKAK